MPLKRTLGDLARDALTRVPEVDVHELRSLLDGEGCLVVDVREDNERLRGFVPGSVHCSRGVLERDIERVAFGGGVGDGDLDQPIVCYCAGGVRSLLAAEQLTSLGFSNVRSLTGGMKAWVQSGAPVATG